MKPAREGKAVKQSETKRPTTKKTSQLGAVVEVIDDAQTSPVQTAGGSYFMIDSAVTLDSIVIIQGWASTGLQLHSSGILQSLFISRPDATQAISSPAIGFICVLDVLEYNAETTLFVTWNDLKTAVRVRANNQVELSSILGSLKPYFSELHSSILRSAIVSRGMLDQIKVLPDSERQFVNGHVDEARFYSGFGIACFGWNLASQGDDMWIVTSGGEWRSLNEATRYNRGDIDTCFSEDYGVFTAGAGFFCTLRTYCPDVPQVLALVVARGGELFTASQTSVKSASLDPVSYARWAFSLPVPKTRFSERLDAHDGELVEHLLSKRRQNYPKKIEDWTVGRVPDSPKISIIVPLYGRADFMEHQLIEFSRDPDFAGGDVELIYVVDDPNLIETVRGWSINLGRLYGVPFRVLWGNVNRGYSGANNIGIRAARGSTCILLNSDVFTSGHGWAAEMADMLEQDATVCAVGARLEYADGSIQHLGMNFEYEPAWRVWLNKHPRQGADVPPTKYPTYAEVPAVTGACFAARTTDLLAIGGLDESYLIGDFEDSDLCLQLRKNGGKVVLLTHTRHVHLERQSFSLFAENSFREMITRFNAWRHTRRWNDTLEYLTSEKK